MVELEFFYRGLEVGRLGWLTSPEKYPRLVNRADWPEIICSGSLGDWRNWIEKRLSERPESEEAIGALKRLCNRGLVRLAKYTAQYNSWSD